LRPVTGFDRGNGATQDWLAYYYCQAAAVITNGRSATLWLTGFMLKLRPV